MKIVLPSFAFLVVFCAPNLFVDARRIFRGSESAWQRADGVRNRELPEASIENNNRILKSDKSEESNKSTDGKGNDSIKKKNWQGDKSKEVKEPKVETEISGRQGDKNKDPTMDPTRAPTNAPTNTPTKPQKDKFPPTSTPTITPTGAPVSAPTGTPSKTPTRAPVSPPTRTPSNTPTRTPVSPPTRTPTNIPTRAPVSPPTRTPSNTPTRAPVSPPTRTPSNNPTRGPVSPPTRSPSSTPTRTPTNKPVATPTPVPAVTEPSEKPTIKPSIISTIRDATEAPTMSMSDLEFDETKFVAGERLKPMSFHMTVSKLTDIMNEEKLEIYFQGFIEDVLDMRSNKGWYPFHVKSISNVTIDLLPIFVLPGGQTERSERSANLNVPVQIIVNGLVFVHSNKQQKQGVIGINESEDKSSFHDFFEHSLLLYLTFWGVDNLQTVLIEDGGLQNPVIDSVFVGTRQLIRIDSDGNLHNENHDSSESIESASTDIKSESSKKMSNESLFTFIMVSVSTIWCYL